MTVAGINERKSPLNEVDLDAQGCRAVVAVSSFLGLVGQAGSAPCSAAKAGVANLVRSAGQGYGQTKICVNAVAPGYVETPLTAGLDESVRSQMTVRQHLCHLGTPEEIIEVICILASDAASLFNGAVWSADGGYVAQQLRVEERLECKWTS